MSMRVSMIALASTLLAACAPETVEEQPDDVTGRWTTEEPKYADRAFEITNEYIYMLQGGDTFSVHRIQGVELSHDDLPLYDIEYWGDEGDLFTFSFYLSQEDGGTLYFPNQLTMKWNRNPDAEVPWELIPESNDRDDTPD